MDAVTLTIQQIPAHTHPLIASNLNGNSRSPENGLLAAAGNLVDIYIQDSPDVTMHPEMMESVGAGQPHSNLGPYLSVSFFMCTNENGCSGTVMITINFSSPDAKTIMTISILFPL